MQKSDHLNETTPHTSLLDILLYLLTGSAMLVLSYAFLNWLRF